MIHQPPGPPRPRSNGPPISIPSIDDARACGERRPRLQVQRAADQLGHHMLRRVEHVLIGRPPGPRRSVLVHGGDPSPNRAARHAQRRPTGCRVAPASAASTQSQSCARCAAASAVISAWSKGGETSTMSMPTRSSAAEPAHQLQRLPAREPARHRRPGARREGGVEPVDVEGEIDRRVPGPRADHLERRGDAVAVQPGRGQDLEAQVLVVEGADADLRRAARVDQPLADRPAHHRAVVDPARIVRPEVAVRVDLDQRQRPVPRGVRPQQRPGDEMVAAERQQLRARRRSPPPPPPRSPAPPSRDGAGRAWRRRGRPPPATRSRSKPQGNALSSASCTEAARIARGPSRQPGR